MALSDVLKRLIYEIKVDTSGVPADLANLDREIEGMLNRVNGRDAVVDFKAETKELDAKVKEVHAQAGRPRQGPL
jgi:NAD-specific glutamate dehydrogenase